jgi:hypothetical protein
MAPFCAPIKSPLKVDVTSFLSTLKILEGLIRWNSTNRKEMLEYVIRFDMRNIRSKENRIMFLINCPFLAIKIPLPDRLLRTSYQMFSFTFLPVGGIPSLIFLFYKKGIDV